MSHTPDYHAEMLAAVPGLRRLARRLTSNWTAADDLVQDTLERALRKIDLYQPTGSFSGWLSRMMRNLHLDRVRSEAVRRTEPLDDEIDLPSRRADQDVRVYAREVGVLAAGLPVEQRAVLHRVCVEEATYEEAAADLGIAVGTVKSRLWRARRALEPRLGPDPSW